VCYFSFPDVQSGASLISVRFGLLFFISLIVWLSFQKFSKWILIVSTTAILFSNFILNIYYYKSIEKLSKIAINCNSFADYIEPNSVVLPVNFSTNWLLGHFHNYIGIDKTIILLKNYEADLTYFPLKWNDNKMPNNKLGPAESGSICTKWKSNVSNAERTIDYVFILGKTSNANDCDQSLLPIILDNYKLIHGNEIGQLYKYFNN